MILKRIFLGFRVFAAWRTVLFIILNNIVLKYRPFAYIFNMYDFEAKYGVWLETTILLFTMIAATEIFEKCIKNDTQYNEENIKKEELKRKLNFPVRFIFCLSSLIILLFSMNNILMPHARVKSFFVFSFFIYLVALMCEFSHIFFIENGDADNINGEEQIFFRSRTFQYVYLYSIMILVLLIPVMVMYSYLAIYIIPSVVMVSVLFADGFFTFQNFKADRLDEGS